MPTPTTRPRSVYTKQFRQIVEALAHRLVKIFNITDYEFEIKFHERDNTSDNTIEHASMRTDIRYLRAELNIRPRLFEIYKTDPNYLVRALIHEFIHVVLAPYDVYMAAHTSPADEPFVTNLQENAVQRLTAIMYSRLYDELTRVG